VSRKDLSRTVIEGGRRYYNSWERRQSHATERASTRAWLDQVSVDEDVADERVVPPRRRVHKDFHDKLSPARRWLAAQVGRPWNKVYAELRARFDSRTIAGQHVVQDHLLGWVDRGDRSHGDPWHRGRDFVVDARGILREGAFYGASWSRMRKEAAAFALGRRAANTYRGWWWFRTAGTGGACFDRECTARHEVLARQRYHAPGLVPDRAMTRGEVRRLDRLQAHFRNAIVVQAPCGVWRA
jgi:hypothetical protein